MTLELPDTGNDINASCHSFPSYSHRFKTTISIGTSVILAEEFLEESREYCIKSLKHNTNVLRVIVL
jgi:hypothetical protein